jgi:hypothetical protein
MKVVVLIWLLVAQQTLALLFSLDFFPVTDHRIFADYRSLTEMKAYRLQRLDNSSKNFLLDDDKFSFNYKMEKLVLENPEEIESHLISHLKKLNLRGKFALYQTSVPDIKKPLDWKNERLIEVIVPERLEDD